MLSDAIFAEKNQQTNHIVYPQLAMKTVGGTAHHLVKRFEDTKDGNAAWESMCEWYGRDVIKNETKKSLRSKLESYHLTLSSNTENDINNFLTAYI